MRRRSIIILAIFLASMTLIAAIGRQIILGDTLPQAGPASESAAENSISNSVSLALKNPSNSSQSLIEGKDYQLTNRRYFDNNQWLVATVIPIAPRQANPAKIVLKLTNDQYNVVLGPGTFFSAEELSKLPADVASFISNTDSSNK